MIIEDWMFMTAWVVLGSINGFIWLWFSEKRTLGLLITSQIMGISSGLLGIATSLLIVLFVAIINTGYTLEQTDWWNRKIWRDKE